MISQKCQVLLRPSCFSDDHFDSLLGKEIANGFGVSIVSAALSPCRDHDLLWQSRTNPAVREDGDQRGERGDKDPNGITTQVFPQATHLASSK